MSNVFREIFQNLESLVELGCDPAAGVPTLHAGEEPEHHLQVLSSLTVNSILIKNHHEKKVSHHDGVPPVYP